MLIKFAGMIRMIKMGDGRNSVGKSKTNNTASYCLAVRIFAAYLSVHSYSSYFFTINILSTYLCNKVCWLSSHLFSPLIHLNIQPTYHIYYCTVIKEFFSRSNNKEKILIHS